MLYTILFIFKLNDSIPSI